MPGESTESTEQEPTEKVSMVVGAFTVACWNRCSRSVLDSRDLQLPLWVELDWLPQADVLGLARPPDRPCCAGDRRIPVQQLAEQDDTNSGGAARARRG